MLSCRGAVTPSYRSNMLVIHDIYSRLQAFCEIEGIDLVDALEAEDQKQHGYLSTVKLLNMFKTLGLRLSSSEQMLLISRLDPTNSGKVCVPHSSSVGPRC